ncbi:cupin domain-containing protein [Nonomuraea sediminis]|uniref:cupin domain-containing protein n=1 Tax=Nonomuraea sediminis TaxID=2835864 RepID=UPI001BDD2F43|nr:cupin domain-containing protein [Nonomuraea sediminis]
MADTVIARKPGEGDAFWMLGGLYEVKAAGSETNGALTIMEMTIPVGGGPPSHTHPGGESVYVLDGTIRFHIGQETVEGGPGSFFYIPEGTWENFEPTSTARVLVIYNPGGMDEFFAEIGERAPAHQPPSAAPTDLSMLIAAADRYGMRMRDLT